jgi:CubicO group peptidase (beta-lactamase class C family)
MINETDLLSVLFYDGNAITVNELSSKKLGELGKMYSMSMAKSYVGYLTGHALCDGVIKKLDDPIGSYVPETKGTLYEGVSIRSMINMSAGDSSYFGDKYTLTAYGLPIMVEEKSIKSMLEGSLGISRSENAEFYYSNILPDIIARAIH